MRSRKQKQQGIANSFDLSISDLMAALCCIFILFLVFTIRKLNIEREDFKKKNAVATEYRLNQQALYEALYSEFSLDLIKWNAEIKLENGTILIRFRIPKDSKANKEKIMFFPDQYEIQGSFKQYFDDFFPRYVSILRNPEFNETIEEIRIEGHTARDHKHSYKIDYEEGIELSQKRTKEVMIYCLDTLSDEERAWVQGKLAAIGYSFSRPMKDGNEINWDISRRVEFSIRSKADNVITEMENTRIN